MPALKTALNHTIAAIYQDRVITPEKRQDTEMAFLAGFQECLTMVSGLHLDLEGERLMLSLVTKHSKLWAERYRLRRRRRRHLTK